MTSIEGVDYAFSKPTPAALKAAGKHFAVRYGGPGSASKQLSASEYSALKNAGIDVVANAEGAASGFKGAAAGKSWAQQAETHFKSCGMPPTNRPIYFSVDWDAGAKDWANIDAALRGAASVIGAGRVGVYGSYDVMQHCRSAGTAKWFWQTYAWSGGRAPSSFVHLFQYHNGVKIGGADCDLTRALLPDFGQWGYKPADASGRTVTYVNISGDLPVLHQGDNDPVKGTTTNYIKRAQSVLAWIGGYDGEIDGGYGPKMAAATKEMMKDDKTRSSSNGSVFGLPEWKRAYGIW